MLRPVALVSVPSLLVFSTFALAAPPRLLTIFPYLSVTLAWALNFLLPPMLVVVQAKGQVPVSRLPAVTSACAHARRSGAAVVTVREADVPSMLLSFALRAVLWAS